MSNKHIFHNNFKTTLVGAISAAATTATLADIGPLVTPASGETLHLTLFDASGNVEIISVTDVTGNDITIVRDQEGTTGPAGGWPNGANVEARLTAGALSNMVQGSPPRRWVKTDLDPWPANTFVVTGDVVYRADTYVMMCLKNGTTGAVEPTSTAAVVVDGDTEWQTINLNGAPYDDMFEAGLNALAAGDQCAALGDKSRALRFFSIAAGWLAAAGNESAAFGPRSFAAERAAAFGIFAGALSQGAAFGYNARAGIDCVALGPWAGHNTDVGLEFGRKGVTKSFVYGERKFLGADYSIAMLGHPIVSAFRGSFEGSANIAETAEQSAGETVIYSVPVNLGDSPAWAASTVHQHGDVVFPTTPNGFCYVAKVIDSNNDDYFTSKTSGTVEPTWPTTPGFGVLDTTGLRWLCVNPADIQFSVGDYSRFVPTQLGFICDEGASPITQPNISFGIPGNLTKWLASTATTKLTGALAGEFFTPTNTEGSKTMAAGLVTAGTGNITGRFYLKGMVIETMTL